MRRGRKKEEREAVGMDCPRYFLFSTLDAVRNAGEKKKELCSAASIGEKKNDQLTRTIVVRKRNLWHNFYITISSAFLCLSLSLFAIIDRHYLLLYVSVCGHPMNASNRSM